MFELAHMDTQALAQLIKAQSKLVEAWYKGGAALDAQPPLLAAAAALRTAHYGQRVFFRGLIEYSNHCARGCYYCGLRAQNAHIERYRLGDDEIVKCVEAGYALGFRSFVLQGGEDAHFNTGRTVDIVSEIKLRHPDCALTLSSGELPDALYEALRRAGADRYLLRHETANPNHYAQLHPKSMSRDDRVRCLHTLKALGYAVGAGMMVGSPHQSHEMLAEDLIFLRELAPEMVGIGPFLPQSQTPFAAEQPGSLALTLTMIALTRLLLPRAMLPSTTALGTLVQGGRELGLRAGANVVMPNLTPMRFRSAYLPYDGKTGVDVGTKEGLSRIIQSVEATGFAPDFSRGDPSRAEEVISCP